MQHHALVQGDSGDLYRAKGGTSRYRAGERRFDRQRRESLLVAGPGAAALRPRDLLVLVLVVPSAVPPRDAPHLQPGPGKRPVLLVAEKSGSDDVASREHVDRDDFALSNA